MALDDREYILNRRGWNPAKLTGCRKNPEIYNPKEFRGSRNRITDSGPEISDEAKRDIFWSLAVIGLWVITFLTWRYFF